MNLSALQVLLQASKEARVLCVGDVMVDRYVYGGVARVSPEAPVPVLHVTSTELMLGGAGNVARNVASLGGRAILIGVVGDDAAAGEVLDFISGTSGLESRLARARGRPTTVKTRFVAAGQQLLRLDDEDVRPALPETEAELVRAIMDAAEGAGVILLSDYAKGVVTPAVTEACLRAARAHGAALIVDAKAKSLEKYGAADLVKPNALELSVLTGLPTQTDEEVETALASALHAAAVRSILVTRGAMGMSLAERGRPVLHFRGAARQVFDVSGAGDSGLAALGLALAARAGIEDAVAFAVLASGVAVTKVGTAAVTVADLIDAELTAYLGPAEAKVVTLEQAAAQARRWRAQGLKIGFTNGCFDILHRGHMAYLSQAKSWCDRLIVGLNSDASVRGLKGDGRPVNDLESRALVLAGLSSVDMVAPFGDPTPIELIKAVHPNVLIKGADYTIEGVVGSDEVLSWGGHVKLAHFVEGHSTTALIDRMARAS